MSANDRDWFPHYDPLTGGTTSKDDLYTPRPGELGYEHYQEERARLRRKITPTPEPERKEVRGMKEPVPGYWSNYVQEVVREEETTLGESSPGEVGALIVGMSFLVWVVSIGMWWNGALTSSETMVQQSVYVWIVSVVMLLVGCMTKK